MPSAIASICFPGIIDFFCRTYSDATLEIHECPSDRLIPRLRSGTAEIAALILPMTEKDIHLYPLGSDQLCIVLPDTHRLGDARSIRLVDMLEERLVLLREDFKINRFIAQAYAEYGSQTQIAGRTSDIFLLMAMVLTGVGLGVVPSKLCRGEWMLGLSTLHVMEPPISFDLVMANAKTTFFRMQARPGPASARSILRITGIAEFQPLPPSFRMGGQEFSQAKFQCPLLNALCPVQERTGYATQVTVPGSTTRIR